MSVLNERERQVLAHMEHTLSASDPELARLLAGSDAGGGAVVPTLLLVAGIALMVLGSAVATVPIAVTGMALSVTALLMVHTRPGGSGGSSRA